MKIDKSRLTIQLHRDEGFVPHAYKDSLGYWTIGYGRLIDQRKGGHISQEEGEFLLGNDIEEKYLEVIGNIPWAAALDPVRLAALVNMAFQLGLGGLLQFKQTLAAIRDGKYDHAEQLALQSLWAKQTPARARRVARQIATGEWQ